MAFRKAGPADLPALFDVWQGAVEASHTFLSAARRAEIAQAVKYRYLPAAELLVYETEGRIVGFMGCTEANIDALFIDPAWHRRGIGTLFIDRMKAEFDHLSVQVNERQPAAQAFYRAKGFVEVRRQPADDSGRPFPVIHMLWRNKP